MSMPMTDMGVWPMAAMGLITSVLAPAVVLLCRLRPGWRAVLAPLSWPAPIALIGFVLLHGLLTIGLNVHPVGTALSVVAHVVLLVGAVVFWSPILGTARRLDPAAGTVYLFVGAPALDLAGVFVVARGDAEGGLAMIVAMLPIGLVALWSAWRWICAEEAAARAVDTQTSAPSFAAPPRG